MSSISDLAKSSAVDVADMLLVTAVWRGFGSLRLEPEGTATRISAQLPEAEHELVVRLPSPLGDAVAIRLGLLSGIDPWQGRGGLGRLQVRAEQASGDFLVALRGVPGSLGVDLSRVFPSGEGRESLDEGGVPRRIGPYELEREVGRGGMGIVYRAEDTRSARHVAVKVLRAEVAAEQGLASQLVREGQAASVARHDGIVAVLDFGVLGDGRAFLVMEWVGDPTLEKVLAGGALPWVRAAGLARRIAEALSTAHVRGVVHRDLKPSNVFVGAGDSVKLADFGAAKVLRESGQDLERLEDFAVGTPLYMAPEQIRGHSTDEATDVYALGCMLFEMVAGQPPFVGETIEETLMMHLREPAPSPASPHGELPAALHSILTRALSKDPLERFSSAGSLSEALGRLLAAHRRAGGR